MDAPDALEKFASPPTGVRTSSAQLRLELLASHQALEGEGDLAPDVLESLIEQAKRSRDRLAKRTQENEIEEQGLAIFDELVVPRLDDQQLAQWKAAIDPPPASASTARDSSTSVPADWRQAARTRQEKSEKEVARALAILSRHGKIESPDQIRWGQVRWRNSIEFSTTLLRAARLAARVGTDGSRRPGPELQESDVVDRFHDLIERASTGRTFWGSRALKAACVEFEKEDNDVVDKVGRSSCLLSLSLVLGSADTCWYTRWRQWLDENMSRTARSAAFEGTYAGLAGPAKQPARKSVPASVGAASEDAAPQNAEGSARMQNHQKAKQAAEEQTRDDAGEHERGSDDGQLESGQAGEPSRGDADVGDGAAAPSASAQAGAAGPTWMDKGKWRALPSTCGSTAAGTRPPAAFVQPQFAIDVSERLANTSPDEPINIWPPQLAVPSARFSVSDLPVLAPGSDADADRDARRQKVGLRSLAEERRALADRPLDSHAEMLLSAHEHCAGIAWSLTNIIAALLFTNARLHDALSRLEEDTKSSAKESAAAAADDTSYASQESNPAPKLFASNRGPLAPLAQNTLSSRKRSLSGEVEGDQAPRANPEPTGSSVPKRPRSATALRATASSTSSQPDSATRATPAPKERPLSASPGEPRRSGGGDSPSSQPPDEPTLFFAHNASHDPDFGLCITLLAHLIQQTSLVSTCEEIEERALDEGVAAAVIAKGSAEIDEIVHEYLDDDGSHEPVGMEGSGALGAVDKPLVPVLIDAIRRHLLRFREKIETDRSTTCELELLEDTVSGRYWTGRERLMRQIYPSGYEYGVTWTLDSRVSLFASNRTLAPR